MAEHQKSLYPNIPEGFNEMCRNARIDRGLTLKQVGEKLGIIYSHVSQLERGVRNFNYERAVKFKEFYGLDIDLPEPDLKQRAISRHRPKRPIESDRFLIVVDGEVLEVLTFRKLGKVTPHTLA